jgi:hypothetical protein
LNKALKQLVDSNANIEVQLSSCIEADKERLRSRFAYLALVFNTGMGNQLSWFQAADECRWTGILCSFDFRFFHLSIKNQGLNGAIPDDVGFLSHLVLFDFEGNSLRGALPSSIQRMTSLTDFIVSNNQLGGPLPTAIGAWTRLRAFSVRYNRLTGTVPAVVSKWRLLYAGYFDGNSFSGKMPVIGSNFCPKNGTGVNLWADCLAPEIVCDCCNGCGWSPNAHDNQKEKRRFGTRDVAWLVPSVTMAAPPPPPPTAAITALQWPRGDKDDNGNESQAMDNDGPRGCDAVVVAVDTTADGSKKGLTA